MSAWPTSWLALAAAVGVCAILGLALLILGLWPRRRGSDPHCRKCGYNLTGRTSDVCTECGVNLASRRAIRTGTRHRRWGLALAGVFLLLLVAVPVGTVSFVAVRSIDWYPYAPLWLLLQFLDSPNDQHVSRAFSDIERRFLNGELDTSTVQKLIERCLTEPAYELNTRRSETQRFDLLQDFHQSRCFTADQLARFMDQVMQQPIPELYFSELAAVDAFDWFAEYTGIRFEVDWSDCGIPQDRPILVGARKLPLRTVLRLVLDEIEDLDHPLGFEIRDDKILIASAATLAGRFDTREYDSRTMLDGFLARGARVTEAELATLISEAIGSRSWNATQARIAVSLGELSVNQTALVHKQLLSLLEQLRSPRPYDAVEWKRNVQALRKLDERVPEVSFSDTPFDQMVDWLAQYSGLNVHVDWRRIDALGVSRDTAVEILTRNEPVRTVLEGFLWQAGGNDVKLGYAIHDGVLRITTAAELPRFYYLAVFPLRKSHADANGRFEPFRDRILHEVSPKSWQVEGGTGQLWLFGDRLIALHSFETIFALDRAIGNE